MDDLNSSEEVGATSLHEKLKAELLAAFKTEGTRLGLDAVTVARLANALSELPITEEQVLKQVELRPEAGSEDAGK